jgi:hypothetical protein
MRCLATGLKAMGPIDCKLEPLKLCTQTNLLSSEVYFLRYLL